MNKFDLFVTVGEYDFDIVEHTINFNKNKLEGLDNIFIFNENENFNLKYATDIEKSFFPFTKELIIEKTGLVERSGWIYGQMCNLYYSYLQQNKKYTLTIDSDVFFNKKINFFDGDIPIFTTSDEFHQPYFEHMKRLHPELVRSNRKSGISHHMLFDKDVLTEIFSKVENFHNKPFYEVFLDEIDNNEKSCCAEYEIYFHYVMNKYPEMYKLRDIKWGNFYNLSIKNFIKYDMVSLPHYLKTRPKDLFENILSFKIFRFFQTLKNAIYIKLFIRK